MPASSESASNMKNSAYSQQSGPMFGRIQFYQYYGFKFKFKKNLVTRVQAERLNEKIHNLVGTTSILKTDAYSGSHGLSIITAKHYRTFRKFQFFLEKLHLSQKQLEKEQNVLPMFTVNYFSTF